MEETANDFGAMFELDFGSKSSSAFSVVYELSEFEAAGVTGSRPLMECSLQGPNLAPVRWLSA